MTGPVAPSVTHSRSALLLVSSYCCQVIRNLPLMKIVENASFFFSEVSFFLLLLLLKHLNERCLLEGVFLVVFLFVCLVEVRGSFGVSFKETPIFSKLNSVLTIHMGNSCVCVKGVELLFSFFCRKINKGISCC